MGARISTVAAVVVVLLGFAIFSFFPTGKSKVTGRESGVRGGEASNSAETPGATASNASFDRAYKSGLELLEKEAFAEASTELQEAVRLRPGHGRARYYLGFAYEKQLQREEAIREYELAVRYDPQFATAFASLANLLAEKQDFDGAIANYSEAVKLEPQNATLLNNLGTVLNAKGAFDQALANVEAALRLEPENTAFMVNLGTVYLNKQDARSALEWFTKACDAGDQTACSKQREASAPRQAPGNGRLQPR